MNDSKYILLIFNSPGEDLLKEPKEVKILQQVAHGTVRGASCGPINLCFFESGVPKKEISELLLKSKLKFLIVDEKDSVKKLPKYITQMFDPKFTESRGAKPSDFVEEEDLPKKLSLEDQLKEAVNNEDYLIASRLRDKIAAQKKSKINPIKELFD